MSSIRSAACPASPHGRQISRRPQVEQRVETFWIRGSRSGIAGLAIGAETVAVVLMVPSLWSSSVTGGSESGDDVPDLGDVVALVEEVGRAGLHAGLPVLVVRMIGEDDEHGIRRLRVGPAQHLEPAAADQ